MFSRLHLTLATALTLAATTAAAADGHAEHGTHVHGEARLSVALDGPLLMLELVAPAADLVGFEHAPRDAAEHKQVEAAAAQLRQADALFRLPPAAGCRTDAMDIHSAMLKHAEHDHADHAGGHSDFEIAYRFTCATPAALDRIGVELFRPFPSLGHIEAQFVGPAGQGAAELSAAGNVLKLK